MTAKRARTNPTPTLEPVQISLRNVRDHDALEHYIHRRVARLGVDARGVQRWEVVVDGAADRHDRPTYAARVTAQGPSGTATAAAGSHTPFLGLRDAFESLDSRLHTRAAAPGPAPPRHVRESE